MKTKIIPTLIAVLAFIPLTAWTETVYLNNVTALTVEHYSDSHFQSVDYHPAYFWDARGISSVSVQPFLNIENAQGQSIIDGSVGFDVFYIGSWMWSAFHWSIGDPATITLLVETWESDVHLDVPSGVYMDAELADKFGVPYNLEFEARHPEPHTWSYGYNVLSYEAVPEPSSVLLLASGVIVIFAQSRIRRSCWNTLPGKTQPVCPR